MNSAPTALIATALLAPAAWAQDAAPAPAPAPAAPWRVELRPYAWLLGIDGDLGVRGQKAHVDVSLVDVLEESDSLFAIAGRCEIGYGRLGAFVDGSYASIGVNDASGPLGVSRIDVDLRQTIVDFGLMFRVGDWPPTGNAARGPRHTTLDAFAGGRYVNIDLRLTPELAPRRSGTSSWVDPIAGLKLVLPFAERWHLDASADVGGFGAASDLTWSATALAGYDFQISGLPASVYAGYRAIGWDYSKGSGANESTWDLTEHGIVLGLGLRF